MLGWGGTTIIVARGDVLLRADILPGGREHASAALFHPSVAAALRPCRLLVRRARALRAPNAWLQGWGAWLLYTLYNIFFTKVSSK